MTRQSLHDVVRDVATLYREAQKDIELIVELDEDLPPINFDREQLRRVFVNLFDNAVQAMNQKGRLWVGTKYDTKRRRAVVTVQATPQLSLAALDFGTVLAGFESTELYATVLNAGPGAFEPDLAGVRGG